MRPIKPMQKPLGVGCSPDRSNRKTAHKALVYTNIVYNAPIIIKPQGRGGYPRETDIQGCPLGRDFEHSRCPNYLTFREKVTL